MRPRPWVILFIGLGLLVIGLLVISIWHENTTVRTVQWIIPDGYRGFIWVIVDPRDGADIQRVDHAVTLRIPPNGVLRVKDDWFFTADFHKDTAADYSGSPIPTDTDDVLTQGPQAIRLWGLSRSADGVNTQFLGPKSGVDAYYADRSLADDELQRRLHPAPP